MQKIELNGKMLIIPKEFTTEQVEAFSGVVADMGIEEYLYSLDDGKKGKKDALAFISPLLKLIQKKGLLRNVAACAIVMEGDQEMRIDEVFIEKRAELLRKVPARFTMEAVSHFLSTNFDVLLSLKDTWMKFRKAQATASAKS